MYDMTCLLYLDFCSFRITKDEREEQNNHVNSIPQTECLYWHLFKTILSIIEDQKNFHVPSL